MTLLVMMEEGNCLNHFEIGQPFTVSAHVQWKTIATAHPIVSSKAGPATWLGMAVASGSTC